MKRDAAIDRLVSRLEASGMATFNLDDRDMTKPQEPDEIIASLCTFPMGSDFRLVILRSCDHLVKAMSDALVSYLAARRPTPCASSLPTPSRGTRGSTRP